MRWQWTIADGSSPSHEVVVDADPEVAMADLAAAVGLPLHTLNVSATDESAAGEAAPASGTVLPRRGVTTTVGEFALRFRAGPLAGTVVPLPRAASTLGRGHDCDVVVPDPFLSRHQAELRCDGDAVVLVPQPGAAPVRVNGTLVPDDGVSLAPDDLVELGCSVVTVGTLEVEPADLVRDAAGDLDFNRPGRIIGRRPEHRMHLPGERPEDPIATPLPWAMALVPVVLGVVMAFVAHSPAMLLMSAASPVMVVASYRTQRRTTRTRGAQALAKWRQSVASAERQLDEIASEERRRAWDVHPDPAYVREWCRGHGRRLWERRRTDPDALRLRVGVGEQPLPVRLEGQPADGGSSRPYLCPAPVLVDLDQLGVLGIAGPVPVARGLARWLVLQLAATRSPRDLELVVLCPDVASAAWDWVRWLPHLRGDGVGAPWVRIGNTDATRAARVGELAKLVEARQGARADDREARFAEHVVVLIDGVRDLRQLAGLTTVLRDGPAVEVFAVCLDDDASRLPEHTRGEVVVDRADTTLGSVQVTGGASEPRVLLDTVAEEVALECGRALAPLRHTGGDGDARELPSLVRFVDLVGLDLADPAAVAARWTLARGSQPAVIGVGADGPVKLDLPSEGPHALVAGTTGSGKSEFLQTLVAGLALANRPDALNFLLVDYKGTAAFGDCERLPHTVGMVTNLDNRETERALTALDAELVRRERALSRIGAANLERAWDLDPQAARADRLARLVIVIDEFAELAEILPDFVRGLVRIARVGRSLGVHLVLATQRPAGVVSADMQANLTLRVALRMSSRENSVEVLGAADAATVPVSQRGRAFLRRDLGSPVVPFQVARVGGRRPGVHSTHAARPVVVPLGWDALGEPLRVPDRAGPQGDASATDLRAVVDLLCAAADRLGLERNPSPWLPALPTAITVQEIERRDGHGDAAVLGLVDVPAEQAQRALTYRLGTDGHVLVAGASRSGRSTVLRTLLTGLCARFGPDDLHVYCLDFGGNALLAAQRLPHVGAVVTPTEPERAVRLLDRLADEVRRRQQLLAEHGYGDVSEQRAAGDAAALPHAVLLIDRWEGLASAWPLEEFQAIREKVVRLLREGPAAGLSVIVTGDRALLSDRIAAFVETRYTLRLADREDYRLAGIRPASLPEDIPPGRAYFGDPVSEVQFASITDDARGQAQNAALRALATELRERYGEPRQRPLRLDPLPAQIGLQDALALPAGNRPPDGAPRLFVGVGGDDLAQVWSDLAAGGGFVVAGANGSGRSNALAAAASLLAADGLPVLLVCPKTSPASVAGQGLGLPVLTGDLDDVPRLHQWPGAAAARSAIVVDDAELVHGSELDDALIEVVRAARPGALTLVVATASDNLATLLRGIAVEARRSKQGLLLSPGNALEGNAFGTGIPRDLVGRATPGRGIVLRGGYWTPVQVPLVEAVGR